jgi:methionyl aminopeptidase
MRVANQEVFSSSELVKLKNQDWLTKQRVAGKIAALTLNLLEKLVREKTTHSLIELNAIAENFIEAAGGRCTFKWYKGFPAGVCCSVNRQLVHGIPTDYRLQNGDLVSFDLGVTIGGAIADTAISCIYGEPKSPQHTKLIQATEEALMKGIASIKVGERLGVIGNAISRHAKGSGYGVIVNYGGHGLDWETPHASPFVSNKSIPNEGVRLCKNMTLAIEPMFTDGSTTTRVDKDGWTVWCDAMSSAHFEHTVFLHEDYTEIITDRSNL